jgi:hypothetical protein
VSLRLRGVDVSKAQSLRSTSAKIPAIVGDRHGYKKQSKIQKFLSPYLLIEMINKPITDQSHILWSTHISESTPSRGGLIEGTNLGSTSEKIPAIVGHRHGYKKQSKIRKFLSPYLLIEMINKPTMSWICPAKSKHRRVLSMTSQKTFEHSTPSISYLAQTGATRISPSFADCSMYPSSLNSVLKSHTYALRNWLITICANVININKRYIGTTDLV